MGEEEAVGGALGEDFGGEQERGGGGGGVVAVDEDVLGGGEEGRGLRVTLQYSILWNTVSGEYRHPVPVLPIPSSGTRSVLEASSTAPELPFNPIAVIQN